MRARRFNYGSVKTLLMLVLLAVLGSLLLTACGTKEIEVTRVVEKKETIIIEGTPEVVEKEVEVTKIVEKEMIITATPEPPGIEGGKLVWAVHQEISNFDPGMGLSNVGDGILHNVYEPLVRYSSEWTIEPALATSWEISEDGKSYTFKLREGVKFHDGTPFNADAVKFEFDRVTAPLFEAGTIDAYMPTYDSCVVIDEYTVKFNLTDPTPGFLGYLTNAALAIPSPTAVEKYGDDFAIHPVGTGPFMFKENVPGDHLTLVKNPDYNWASEMWDHQGPAYLDELEIRWVVEDATRLVALETDEIQMIERVPASEITRLSISRDYGLVSPIVPGLPQMHFLNAALSPTDDLRVRKAINYAVDKEGIAKAIYFDTVIPAYGPISSMQPEYDPELEKMYPYDPDKARALLEEAGWVDTDGDGVREKDGEILHVDIQYDPAWHQWTEAMGAMIEEVGFEVSISAPGWPIMSEAFKDCSVHLLPMGMASAEIDNQKWFWHSSQLGVGFAGHCFNSPEIDAIIDQAIIETDPEKRTELWRDLQRIVMENALEIPIHELIYHTGFRSYVKGVKLDATGFVKWFYDVYYDK